MTDTTEIAARYGVPTPEELAAEYERRGMTWMRKGWIRDDGGACVTLAMLAMQSGLAKADVWSMTPAEVVEHLGGDWRFLYSVNQGSFDTEPRRTFSRGKDGDNDGWDYGAAVRLLMAEVTHD